MMLGHMPSLEFIYDFFPQPRDVLWSPADWAWMAGLMDVLMPGWFHGCTVVASAMKGFDAEQAYRILAEHRVTLALLTPTMLKLMRQVPEPLSRYRLALRAVLSGGEAVGAGLLEWAGTRTEHRLSFGQTECNVILATTAVFRSLIAGKPTWRGGADHRRPRQRTATRAGSAYCRCFRIRMLKEYLNKPGDARQVHR